MLIRGLRTGAFWAVPLLSLGFGACVFDPQLPTPQDFGNNDTGVVDLGVRDSGQEDSTFGDASPGDGPILDATPDTGLDGGLPDADDTGVDDTGPMDTGFVDSGIDTGVDVGFPDVGFPDTGIEDVGFPDTGFDAGPTDGGFPYVPSNTIAPGGGTVSWQIAGGATCSFNSTSLVFNEVTPGDCGMTPTPDLRLQTTGPEAVVLSVAALSVAGLLEIRGGRPVIVLVYGDATIAGTVDLGANGSNAGPGAQPADCVPATGQQDGTIRQGGGGGGFGMSAASAAGSSSSGIRVPFNGNNTITPLRGGWGRPRRISTPGKFRRARRRRWWRSAALGLGPPDARSQWRHHRGRRWGRGRSARLRRWWWRKRWRRPPRGRRDRLRWQHLRRRGRRWQRRDIWRQRRTRWTRRIDVGQHACARRRRWRSQQRQRRRWRQLRLQRRSLHQRDVGDGRWYGQPGRRRRRRRRRRSD